MARMLKENGGVEKARNFFERKSMDERVFGGKQNEGRFEKIVKDTSNVLEKACTMVKGSLGFEARSESSDLGLGSESGSDTRGRSVDDETDVIADESVSCNSSTINDKDNKRNHANLARSHSCLNSMDSQDSIEFDHVRYKIVKSNLFGKRIFNGMRKDVTYEGLMQYLREYSFQELLLDNNVVIIEPVRAEPVERVVEKKSCRVAGTIEKKSLVKAENCDDSTTHNEPPKTIKLTKQSSLRKHFFYQPIRVNRELIDEELPNPDTVKNVRLMFEKTLKLTGSADGQLSRDCKTRKSVSMKDLTSFQDRFDDELDKSREGCR